MRWRDEIALYTGNDDSIAADLLFCRFEAGTRKGARSSRRSSADSWAMGPVRVKSAVTLMDQVRLAKAGDGAALSELLEIGSMMMDANGAIFDAAHHFVGCIPSIRLPRRQRLLEGVWLLDESEVLSPWPDGGD